MTLIGSPPLVTLCARTSAFQGLNIKFFIIILPFAMLLLFYDSVCQFILNKILTFNWKKMSIVDI